MKKDPKLHVIHILESIEEVRGYIPSEATLHENRMAYQAALRVLQTLAESASKLPTEMTNQFPDIPWQTIYRFRNVIAHDYLDDYNREMLWKVIAHELSPLEKAMLALLPDWNEIKKRRQ